MENKGFEIKCLNCGSTDCEIMSDYDYNSLDELKYNGDYVRCNDCGQDDRFSG